MKKYLSYLLTLAVIAPVLVSCKEEMQDPTPPDQKHTVHFSSAEDVTRTGLAIDGNTVVPNWEKTSVSDVHLYEIDGSTKTLGTNTGIEPSADNLTARFVADFSGASGTYKYGAVVAETNDAGAFCIPAIQTPDPETLKDPRAEFLVGYSRFEYTAPTGEDNKLVDLFFDRVAALSRIGFVSFDEDDQKVMSVTIKSDKSMTGYATIADINFDNPSTVTFMRDEGTGVITLNYGDGASIPTDKPFYAYFVSMPGTFTITSIEVQTDKNHYVKSVGTEVTLSLTELKNLKLNLTGSVIPVQSVAVAPTTLDMKVGEKKTVSATVLPENASDRSVTWTSKDETVATVNATTGEVEAIKSGTATITATTTDGGMTASCTVTVSDAHKYTLAISTVGDKTEIKHGETLAYTATLTTITNGDNEHPATTVVTNDVVWESTNTNAATISDQGVATGVAEGETTIKATYTPDDAEAVTTDAILNVKDAHSYRLAITAAGDKSEIKHGESLAYTATLTTITNGDNEHPATTVVTNDVVWESTNTNAATISDQGVATGVAEGETTIKATYTPDDAEAVTADATLNVKNVYEYELVISPNKDVRVVIDKTETFTLTLKTKTNGGDWVTTDVESNAASWSSSNDDYATITNGVAKGVAEGTVKITAKYTPTGSSEELQAEVLLTVLKDPNHAGDPIGVGEEENL